MSVLLFGNFAFLAIRPFGLSPIWRIAVLTFDVLSFDLTSQTREERYMAHVSEDMGTDQAKPPSRAIIKQICNTRPEDVATL